MSSRTNSNTARGSFRTLAVLPTLALVTVAAWTTAIATAETGGDPNVLTDPQTEGPIDTQGGEEIPNESDGGGDEDPTGLPLFNQNFRVNLTVTAGGFQELLFLADQPNVNVHLIGSGVSNLDMVLIDEEAGMIAVAKSQRDQEFISFGGNEPRILRVIILNWGKTDNPCTLSSY